MSLPTIKELHFQLIVYVPDFLSENLIYLRLSQLVEEFSRSMQINVHVSRIIFSHDDPEVTRH